MKSMKIETGLTQLIQRSRGVQCVESNDDTPLQGRSDLGRSPRFEKLLETSVAKASDHVSRL